jgi:hypothetical protein
MFLVRYSYHSLWIGLQSLTVMRPHVAGLEPGYLSDFYRSLECLKNISNIQRQTG